MKRTLAILLWGYSIAHLLHGAFRHAGHGDFLLILEEVLRWLQTGQPWVRFLACTPLHALLMIPFALLPSPWALLLMHTINGICLALILVLLREELPQPARPHFWPWIAPLALNFRPLLCTLAMAKIELVELLLLLCALRAFRQGHERRCGALLALGALLKFIPGVLLACFAWRRRPQVLLGAAACALPLCALTLLAYGLPAHLEYTRNLLSGFTPWLDNQSLRAALHRLFAPWPWPTLDPYPASAHPLLAHLLSFAGRAAALCALLCVRRTLRRDVSLWLAALPLLLSFFRDYYAVYLLVPFGQLLTARGGAATLGVLAYLLIGQGLPLGLLLSPSGLDRFLYLSVPFWGALLLFCALLLRGTIETCCPSEQRALPPW